MDGEPGADLLKRARERGVITLLDECWGLGPDRGTLETMLPFADYVLPSYDDMSAIYENRDPEGIADELLEKGASKVVLKMGEKGCFVASGTVRRQMPSCATRIVDTTGAGDCFNAGFLAGLVHGLSDLDCAVIGNRAAAACIANVGGAIGIPGFDQLRSGQCT
jgi:sugar/nucleoside kinase (ribokinase family)